MELKSMKNMLDSIATICDVTGDNETKKLYEDLKKEYKAKIVETKRNKNTEYIMKSDNKNKAIWSVISNETQSSKKKEMSNTKITADNFNTYFESDNKNKAIWSVISNETQSSKKKEMSNTKITADNFNTYFVSVGNIAAQTIRGPHLMAELLLANSQIDDVHGTERTTTKCATWVP
ncbi:hypothetical protein QE152_g4206 [Popillia japonica]|uniref:Uncharacterized protein n=1 Tax=Popillia japonica TaxID=7064 RepID=A0AAW1MW69_POPJA